MSKHTRNIVEIDEELCTGCGQCILDCAEGAIAIVNGKAKVIADMYCDGLGACLSGCPTGALTIVQREADAYDEEAVEAHLARQGRSLHHGKDAHGHHGHHHKHHGEHGHGGHGPHHGGGGCACGGSAPQEFAPRAVSGCGCPGSQAAVLTRAGAGAQSPFGMTHGGGLAAASSAGNSHWPLKIRLMSPDAPFLKGADLLVAADCTAFASAAFHAELRSGAVMLIGCPKFEDNDELAGRLTAIFRTAKPKSCTVVRMEVPCCRGLLGACRVAQQESGVHVPLRDVIITRQGDISVQEK